MASIKQRGNTYQITVALGYSPDGTQIRKTTTFRPAVGLTEKQAQKAAEKAAAEFEAKLKEGYIMETATVQEYFEKWLASKTVELAPKTIEHYRELTHRIFTQIGHIPLSKLRAYHIQDFYRFLGTEKGVKTKKPLTPESIKHYHRFLSSVLREAFRLQIIGADIMAHVIPPKVPNQAQKAILSDAEAKQFVAALLDEPDIRKETSLLLLLYSGCRVGELLGLQWRDINYPDYSISINRSVQYLYHEHKTIVKTPKTKTSQRIVSLPPDLFPLLKEYRSFWLECAVDSITQEDFLFVQRDGKTPLFPTTISKWLKDFLAANGLPAVSVHSLRHSCITFQIMAGVPLRQVSARAGHANQSTTANIYSHALLTADKLAAQKLAEVLPLTKNAADF